MLSLRLPKEIEDRLDKLSHKTGRTKTYYVKEAIYNYLDDLEDKYLAISRLENPSNETWSLKELEKDSDLES